MSDTATVCNLFDMWEQVWHERRYDLVPACIADTYVRHDEAGNRSVTRDAYAAEIAKIHAERPGIRVVVYDHAIETDRAWFRFAFQWVDAATGERRSRAGMQSYRIEDGRIAETWVVLWPLGSVWPDRAAQDCWTKKTVT